MTFFVDLFEVIILGLVQIKIQVAVVIIRNLVIELTFLYYYVRGRSFDFFFFQNY